MEEGKEERWSVLMNERNEGSSAEALSKCRKKSM